MTATAMTLAEAEELSVKSQHADLSLLRSGRLDQHPPFQLEPRFVAQFIGKQPNWGPVGYVTYKRTYAREKEDGTFEEFWETVRRVVEGTYRVQQRHCEQLRLPWRADKAQRSAQEMFMRIWQFKFLPPGRGLQMMGAPPIEKLGGAPLNNCGFVSTAQIRTSFSAPFCFLMDMSMLGAGVGFDTKGAGQVTIQEPRQGRDVHIVSDDREGWVDLVRRVLDAYVGEADLPCDVDYTEIRKKGAPIKTFGGVASGPGPLIQLYEDLHVVLAPLIGKTITSTAIVDIFNLVGKCVVSGNVRRTAEIGFGDPNDQEFRKLKDPSDVLLLEQSRDWLKKELALAQEFLADPQFVESVQKEDPNWLPTMLDQTAKHKVKIAALEKQIKAAPINNHRWASNNSLFATVGMDYTSAAESTARNGEPGYEWLDNARAYSRMGCPPDYKDKAAAGGNPCLEQTLESFELCCLVETFPAHHDSYEDFQRTLKYAYLYAKTVTLIHTHDARTNAVLLRNRRIGTSQTGIMQSFDRHGRRTHYQWCEKGYEYLSQLDAIYSDWLCVPQSKKKTSVKPSGSVSMLPGATPGVRAPQSEYYIRNVRFAEDSHLLPSLRRSGYEMEPDGQAPNTMVVSFPVHETLCKRFVPDYSMWEQLEIVAQMQQFWADNQVSATITFKPEEAKDIKHALELYEVRLKGISFLPLDGGNYKQAPYITISRDRYEEMVAKLKPLDLSKVTKAHEVQDVFCDGDSCQRPLGRTDESKQDLH